MEIRARTPHSRCLLFRIWWLEELVEEAKPRNSSLKVRY
jgi:hypothetical protein